MGSSVRRVVVLLAVAVAADVAAAPRLTVGPIAGDRRAALPTQLAGALCARFECVLWPVVATRGVADEARTRAAGVAGVLTGAVARGPGGAEVVIALGIPGVSEPPRWRFPLTTAGLLSGEDLRRLETALVARLMVRAPTPTPTRTAAPPRAPTPTPTPTPTPRPTPTPTPASTSTPPRVEGRFLLAAEAGAFFGSRLLDYSGSEAGSSTLRGFEARAVVGARLHLALYPLARRGGAWWAGLGIAADWDRSLGLHADAPSGGERPVERSRWRAGLAWRSPTLAGRLVLVPAVAYESWTVATRPAIDGLPDAELAGVRLGLGAELALGRRLTLLAGAGWVRWHQARDLVAGEPAFFPGGSATGLSGEAGVAVAVHGPLSARLVLEHAATRYTLRPDPSGRYAASRATDSTTEVRAVARLTF